MRNLRTTQKAESNLWAAELNFGMFFIYFEVCLHKSQLEVATEALSIVISALLLGSFESLKVSSKGDEEIVHIEWRENFLPGKSYVLPVICEFLDSYATISPVHKKEATEAKEFLIKANALPF